MWQRYDGLLINMPLRDSWVRKGAGQAWSKSCNWLLKIKKLSKFVRPALSTAAFLTPGFWMVSQSALHERHRTLDWDRGDPCLSANAPIWVELGPTPCHWIRVFPR